MTNIVIKGLEQKSVLDPSLGQIPADAETDYDPGACKMISLWGEKTLVEELLKNMGNTISRGKNFKTLILSDTFMPDIVNLDCFQLDLFPSLEDLPSKIQEYQKHYNLIIALISSLQDTAQYFWLSEYSEQLIFITDTQTVDDTKENINYLKKQDLSPEKADIIFEENFVNVEDNFEAELSIFSEIWLKNLKNYFYLPASQFSPIDYYNALIDIAQYIRK